MTKCTQETEMLSYIKRLVFGITLNMPSTFWHRGHGEEDRCGSCSQGSSFVHGNVKSFEAP